MLTFAEFLSKRRAALGMSMTELASNLSVTPQYISLLEAGKCNPSKKLQERCAKFFGEDLEYIRFLAQPMPREQKRALLRNPSALPFLSRRAREMDDTHDASPREAVQIDGEDAFIQKLFLPVERGVPAQSAPFYDLLIEELRAKDADEPRFSAKTQAWAQFYQAVLTAQTEGRRAARPLFEALLNTLESDRGDDTYPDTLRLKTASQLAASLADEADWEEAGRVYEQMAEYAQLTDDTERALEAYRQAAKTYEKVGRPDRVIAMYNKTTATDDIPAPAKAELFMEQAELVFNLGDARAAFEPVQQAVKIWRLRSLNIDNKTAQLVSAQILGLHILVDLGERDEARQWLGRIRSTLARVTEAEMSSDRHALFTARSDLESAAMMVQQGRWNHAWKNLDDVETQLTNGGLAFDDEDDKALFAQRILVLKAEVAAGKDEPKVAEEIIDRVFKQTPPADPVRAKGRFTHQRGQVLDVLKRIGESDAARRKALLKELTADAKSDAATRNLLETPQIAAIRDGLGG